MIDDITPDDTPETPAQALKRVLAAKKAAGLKGGGTAFKSGQHPEKSAAARNASLAKPAFRKASKRG